MPYWLVSRQRPGGKTYGARTAGAPRTKKTAWRCQCDSDRWHVKLKRMTATSPLAPRRINLPAHLEQLRERSLPLSLAYDHLVPSLAVVHGVSGEHARKLGLNR